MRTATRRGWPKRSRLRNSAVDARGGQHFPYESRKNRRCAWLQPARCSERDRVYRATRLKASSDIGRRLGSCRILRRLELHRSDRILTPKFHLDHN
jgi:hypothetical protein